MSAPASSAWAARPPWACAARPPWASAARQPSASAARPPSASAARPPSEAGELPQWAVGLRVPEYLAVRQGTRPLILVAPHGGRRRRPVRRGDSVNDLHTAEIAWELAGRLGAHAIVNHGLDRNDIDLNRIGHLTTLAPEVLALLAAAIEDASQGHEVPLVLFVHGWNMVVPCCDIGIGLRRRGGRLSGRYPTLSRSRYEGTIAAIERQLGQRGISAAIGRRYTASGRDNAAQLFSGRHAAHDDAAVAALGRLAIAGRVDAAQLELGIPLRWQGSMRDALLDGLVEALREQHPAPRNEPDERSGTHVAVPRESCGWRIHQPAAGGDDAALPEAGFGLQAVLDAHGSVATFCGVEATGPRSMVARFSVVCTDGTMMLLVGEGEWSGERGRYGLEGFSWHAEDDGRTIRIHVRAPMVRYPTHDAYLDLEQGLLVSELVDADVSLVFEAGGADHGRLHGTVRAGSVELDVATTAFVDRGGRTGEPVRDRIRIVAAAAEGNVTVARSDGGNQHRLEFLAGAGPLGTFRGDPAAGETGALHEAEILARVPVWRPAGGNSFSRRTFGIVRCRFAGERTDRVGLFDSLEIFPRDPAT